MKQNKQIYIDFIISELNKGNIQYKDVMLVFVSKFELTEQTFVRYWKQANESYKNQRELINNAKIEESIIQEKEAVKIGLKSKIDRLLILQKLVDECLEQLTTKQCNDTIIVEGTVKNIKRLMNQRELNDTRKTLQSLQSEISKIEGDYAPTKSENTNTNIDKTPFFGEISLTDE